MRIFQKTATAILVTFMGILLWVSIVAHMRQSGSTRQDMSQAHLVRDPHIAQKNNRP